MFTGIVKGAANVQDFSLKSNGGARLKITHSSLTNLKLGESVAINGCCLTIAELFSDTATFDILEETLRLTNLGELKFGMLVNIEPSLLLTDRLGGHFVTGHIDCVGTILNFNKNGADYLLDIEAPSDFMRYIVRKGCVSVDGMSLTVADIFPGGFRTWLIPHTLQVGNRTALNSSKRVNLESDLIAKYTEKLISRS